ncbi:hypothetical protein [Xylanibacter muris]|uniref:Uncharacterized protein n=1 Tax=Xylanibacter muris TaxID=2736290 RepID=A0ABX2APD3_9BACT|nr:hypothetical protein [Xylanibacter muris]NPD93049.1 hypothetical protein [Xylanibacter muris]
MQLLKYLIIVFFSCSLMAGMNGCAVSDSVQGVSIKMDSVFRPFKDYEKGSKYDKKLDIWSKMTANEYNYYRDGMRTGYFIRVYIDHEGFPVSLKMDSGNRKGSLSFDDMMNGLKYVLDDMNDEYDLSRMNEILVYAAGYSDETIKISKEYEDSLRYMEDDGGWSKKWEEEKELLERRYNESRMFGGIKEIVALYGKDIKNTSVGVMRSFKTDGYMKSCGYDMTDGSLPKEITVPDYFRIRLQGKDSTIRLEKP